MTVLGLLATVTARASALGGVKTLVKRESTPVPLLGSLVSQPVRDWTLGLQSAAQIATGGL
jgi:hypothetical protein